MVLPLRAAALRERLCIDMYPMIFRGRMRLCWGWLIIAVSPGISRWLCMGRGARLYLTYQNERLGDGIRKLTADMGERHAHRVRCV